MHLREIRREVSLSIPFRVILPVLCATIVVVSLMNRIFLTRLQQHVIPFPFNPNPSLSSHLFTSLHSHFFVGKARNPENTGLGIITYTYPGSVGSVAKMEYAVSHKTDKNIVYLYHKFIPAMFKKLTGKQMSKGIDFAWNEEKARDNLILLSKKKHIEPINGKNVTVVATLTINKVECEGEPSTKKTKWWHALLPSPQL